MNHVEELASQYNIKLIEDKLEIEKAIREVNDGKLPRDVDGAKRALCDVNIKRIGAPTLAKIDCSKRSTLAEPLWLQVRSVRDVTRSKVMSDGSVGESQAQQQDSSDSKRLLVVLLTDGHTSVRGVEHRRCSALSADSVVPGTKVRVLSGTVVRDDCILLTPECLEIVGGRVEELVERFLFQREVGRSKAKGGGEGDGGPPSFVLPSENVDIVRPKPILTQRRLHALAERVGGGGDDSKSGAETQPSMSSSAIVDETRAEGLVESSSAAPGKASSGIAALREARAQQRGGQRGRGGAQGRGGQTRGSKQHNTTNVGGGDDGNSTGRRQRGRGRGRGKGGARGGRSRGRR